MTVNWDEFSDPLLPLTILSVVSELSLDGWVMRVSNAENGSTVCVLTVVCFKCQDRRQNVLSSLLEERSANALELTFKSRYVAPVECPCGRNRQPYWLETRISQKDEGDQ